MKQQAPGSRLFPGSDGPELAEHANSSPISTHDKVEHLTSVIERKRTYALQLHALARVLGDARNVAKNAGKTAEGLVAHDTTAATVEHNLSRDERIVTEAARRHDREIASLGAELERAKAAA